MIHGLNADPGARPRWDLTGGIWNVEFQPLCSRNGADR